ncbi:hypothetical protein CASFOL_032107 [Castilleja foliolosa]|uniref:Uncharacterized protein n=1 Tax=Castilleja foliolosa TaxID=1961234 RepID=A0ABD3C284_9LAMI
MATSAFKSTSRRAAKAPPPAPSSRRRSHSVSAVSRKNHALSDDKTLIPTEFSNNRDNPLFWEESGKAIGSVNSKDKQYSSSDSRNSRNVNGSCSSASEQRGRSVTRSLSGEKNGIGRSLSRVRGRSVSRPPCKGSYESEKEQDRVISGIVQNRNEIRKIGNGINRINLVRNRVDRQGQTMTIQSQATEWSEDDSACSMQISNLEDGISNGSLSEAEEKKIKASSDELNAFLRNNANTFTATNVADTSSDFVIPEAVEFISEIRREYAESEERTRKLRADLAVEEHRGKELDRILKEILPDSNTSHVQRSRRGRRTSNERKRMSKCLNEDAMAYFDECVSLSTFDSSDFSASEDPPYSSAGAASSLVKDNNVLHQKQVYGYEEGSSMTGNSSNLDIGGIQPYDFSFTVENKSANVGPEDYIKNFKKGTKRDGDLEHMLSYYDASEYSIQGNGESLLIDRVLYNSRIESGCLLLCCGANSYLPFASLI